MRRSFFTVILMLLPLVPAGCHGTAPQPAATAVPSRGLSLERMRAEYAKLSSQYKADCLTGSPEHIGSTRALCEEERKRMAPLGNELMAAEAKAAQHATNP